MGWLPTPVTASARAKPLDPSALARALAEPAPPSGLPKLPLLPPSARAHASARPRPVAFAMASASPPSPGRVTSTVPAPPRASAFAFTVELPPPIAMAVELASPPAPPTAPGGSPEIFGRLHRSRPLRNRRRIPASRRLRCRSIGCARCHRSRGRFRSDSGSSRAASRRRRWRTRPQSPGAHCQRPPRDRHRSSRQTPLPTRRPRSFPVRFPNRPRRARRSAPRRPSSSRPRWPLRHRRTGSGRFRSAKLRPVRPMHTTEARARKRPCSSRGCFAPTPRTLRPRRDHRTPSARALGFRSYHPKRRSPRPSRTRRGDPADPHRRARRIRSGHRSRSSW